MRLSDKYIINYANKVISDIVVVNVYGKKEQQDFSVTWYTPSPCLHSVLRIRQVAGLFGSCKLSRYNAATKYIIVNMK